MPAHGVDKALHDATITCQNHGEGCNWTGPVNGQLLHLTKSCIYEKYKDEKQKFTDAEAQLKIMKGTLVQMTEALEHACRQRDQAEAALEHKKDELEDAINRKHDVEALLARFIGSMRSELSTLESAAASSDAPPMSPSLTGAIPRTPLLPDAEIAREDSDVEIIAKPTKVRRLTVR